MLDYFDAGNNGGQSDPATLRCDAKRKSYGGWSKKCLVSNHNTESLDCESPKKSSWILCSVLGCVGWFLQKAFADMCDMWNIVKWQQCHHAFEFRSTRPATFQQGLFACRLQEVQHPKHRQDAERLGQETFVPLSKRWIAQFLLVMGMYENMLIHFYGGFWRVFSQTQDLDVGNP